MSIPGLNAAVINITAVGAGDNTVVTAVAGKNIQIVKLFLTSNTAMTVTFKDGAATLLTGAMTIGVGIPLVINESYAGIPWMIETGNFVINVSAASQVSGRVIYIQE